MSIKAILKRNKIIVRLYQNYCKKRYVRDRNRNLNKNGKTIFNEFVSICRKNNSDIWLCYGTLLGLIRDNGIMKHDDDFDVGLWYKDYSETLEKDLISAGFELEHQFEGINGYTALEQTFKKNGVNIDIFYHFEDEDKIWTHVFHKERDDVSLPKNIWMVRKLDFTKDSFKKVIFIGTEVLIPSNYEQYLIETYGDSWRIPDKNFDWKKGPKKDSILPGILGERKDF